MYRFLPSILVGRRPILQGRNLIFSVKNQTFLSNLIPCMFESKVRLRTGTVSTIKESLLFKYRG